MKRRLIVHLDNKPVAITVTDNTKLPKSFTLGRRIFLKWSFKDSPTTPKAAYVTFCHECIHVLQYENAVIGGRLRSFSFLFSYLGKKLLRGILPKKYEPNDMYEEEANAEEAILRDGSHYRISIPVETRAHFIDAPQ